MFRIIQSAKRKFNNKDDSAELLKFDPIIIEVETVEELKNKIVELCSVDPKTYTANEYEIYDVSKDRNTIILTIEDVTPNKEVKDLQGYAEAFTNIIDQLYASN